MPVILPLVPSIPNYRVSTTLDDTQFIFDLRWNTRDNAWYMDVSTEADEIIRYAIKIVRGAPLGRRTADPRFPTGLLVAAASDGSTTEAGLNDLGTRVQVLYYTVAELEAIDFEAV